MLEAPASQIETRMFAFTALTALPLVVNASSRAQFIWTVSVPQNEQWQLLGVGGILTLATTDLTVVSGIGQITSARWGGRILWFPLQMQNLVAGLQAVVSLLLPGLVGGPGDTIRLTVELSNSDAVNPHNATAEQAAGSVLPIRLTENIAVARRLEPNAEQELNRLLRR